MKYHYVKSFLYCEATISVFVALLGVFIVIYNAGLNIGVIEVALMILSVVLLFLGVRTYIKANRLQASAVFDETGIHIFGHEEIALISWGEVHACKLIPAGSNARPPYLMVVLDSDATIDGKLFSDVNVPVSDTTAKRYRLDEAMEYLVTGQKTVNELKESKVFLAGITKNQYLKIESWWRIARQISA